MRKGFSLLCVLVLAIAFVPSAEAQTPHSVDLRWTPSTSACSGTASQQIYRAACSGTITAGVCSAEAASSKISTVAGTITTFSDTTVLADQKWVYYLTAGCTAWSGESIASNRVAVVIPKDAPGNPPSGLTLTTVSLDTTKGRSYFNASMSEIPAPAPGQVLTYSLKSSKGSLLASGSKYSASGNYDFNWVGTPQKSVTFEAFSASGRVSATVN